MIKLSVKVTKQGAPIVKDGHIKRICSDVALVEIDLISKYCEVDAAGGDDEPPTLYISPTEESDYLMEGADVGVVTIVELPDFTGWDIYTAKITKYTLRVCLTKEAV